MLVTVPLNGKIMVLGWGVINNSPEMRRMGGGAQTKKEKNQAFLHPSVSGEKGGIISPYTKVIS